MPPVLFYTPTCADSDLIINRDGWCESCDDLLPGCTICSDSDSEGDNYCYECEAYIEFPVNTDDSLE
jgi:hypothetical protein